MYINTLELYLSYILGAIQPNASVWTSTVTTWHNMNQNQVSLS